MGIIQDVKSWSRREGSALTIALVVSITLTALFFFSNQFKGISFVGYAGYGLKRPWTLLTYPWAYTIETGAAIIGLVFYMFWLFWIGRSIERDLGPAKMAIFWFAATLLGALSDYAAGALSKQAVLLLGPAIPLAALTVLWCTRNPDSTISLFAVIPITGRWLSLIATIFILLCYGYESPYAGVLDCIPLLAAFLYGRNRVPGIAYTAESTYKVAKKEATTRGQVMYDQSYFDEVKRRETEREERERLKKLLGED